MRPSFSLFLGVFALIVGCRTWAQPEVVVQETSYQSLERLKMLELRKAGSPFYQLDIQDLDDAAPSHRAFLNHYQETIYPALRQIRELGFLSTWYSVALDRALYESPTEKAEWTAEQLKVDKALNELKNGEAWKTAVDRWATLAGSIDGRMAHEAVLMKRRLDIDAFTPDQIPKLNEVSELQTKITLTANDSPFANNLSKAAEAISKAKAAYDAGTLPLAAAAAKVEEARLQGEMGQSRDIAQRVKSELNRCAILRTELARSKGYSTWSAYRVAAQAEPYDARFNSVEERIAFLEGALKRTNAALEKLHARLLAKELSLKRHDLTESHLAILAPDIDSFGRYFPRETVDALWAKTLKQSGFDPSILETITRDVMPRENKYTHAYMTSLNTKMPKSLTINAKTLDVTLPSSHQSEAWIPARIFILQNFFSDSVDSLRVAFHEGGHALQYVFEENPFETPEAYGFVEIHSMTQEYFGFDKEFLKASAKTRDGSQPSDEEIETYSRNAKIQDFLQFRVLLARALFELKLWNTAFTADSTAFTDLAVALYGEIISQGTGVTGSANHGVDFTGRGPLNAPHFRSGWVEYIGYVLANIASYQSYESLLDHVEKQSGRRSLYQQQGLSTRLIEGYYKSGYSQPFPQSVEAFTGKIFSVDDLAKFYENAMEP